MPISNYLRNLRSKVGNDLLLTAAVAVVCRDPQGRVLMARHRDFDQWAIPGGYIDPGESPADAAVREMWEETGVLVDLTRVLGVYSGPRFYTVYPNGDQVVSVDVTFEGRIVQGQLCADQDEVGELAYLSQAEVAGLSLPNWMQVEIEDIFANRPDTSFQPSTWTIPADGVRKGGIGEYAANLRQRIGTDLVINPSVGAVVFNEKKEFLLLQRADNLQWVGPGGAIDPFETPADAVVREVWEETGVLVEPVRVIGVYGGAEFSATFANGDRIAAMPILFECRMVSGSPSPDQIESLDVRFLPPEQALTIAAPRWRKRMPLSLRNNLITDFEPSTWKPT